MLYLKFNVASDHIVCTDGTVPHNTVLSFICVFRNNNNIKTAFKHIPQMSVTVSQGEVFLKATTDQKRGSSESCLSWFRNPNTFIFQMCWLPCVYIRQQCNVMVKVQATSTNLSPKIYHRALISQKENTFMLTNNSVIMAIFRPVLPFDLLNISHMKRAVYEITTLITQCYLCCSNYLQKTKRFEGVNSLYKQHMISKVH